MPHRPTVLPHDEVVDDIVETLAHESADALAGRTWRDLAIADAAGVSRAATEGAAAGRRR
jgi:hypothetical protein